MADLNKAPRSQRQSVNEVADVKDEGVVRIEIVTENVLEDDPRPEHGENEPVSDAGQEPDAFSR